MSEGVYYCSTSTMHIYTQRILTKVNATLSSRTHLYTTSEPPSEPSSLEDDSLSEPLRGVSLVRSCKL